jgi:molybdopterin-binding protein
MARPRTSDATAPGASPKALRARLGLTQAELAELVGAHPMTVSKWERGLLAPSAHQRRVLRALAESADAGAAPARGERGARRDTVRLLSSLLGRAYARPEIELGTLSATNRFPGRVVELARGDVMSKVVIEVAPALRIGAVITTDSVDRMALAVGSRAVAIIKATEVIVGGS